MASCGHLIGDFIESSANDRNKCQSIPLRGTRSKDRKTMEERGSHSSIAMMTNKAKNAYDADPALRLLHKLKLNQNEKERN
jgi:hypothetical protein